VNFFSAPDFEAEKNAHAASSLNGVMQSHFGHCTTA
jgi:hypothetical protein